MIYTTEENTPIDKMLLWWWLKWEWPFKFWPLRKLIDEVFWLQDCKYLLEQEVIEESPADEWLAPTELIADTKRPLPRVKA